ncbi:non-ribosomal peptide synthetase [Sesbania bispinosa]|nr:non-ribosomal peptide synthetase [Sesbania bispinosa]
MALEGVDLLTGVQVPHHHKSVHFRRTQSHLVACRSLGESMPRVPQSWSAPTGSWKTQTCDCPETRT